MATKKIDATKLSLKRTTAPTGQAAHANKEDFISGPERRPRGRPPSPIKRVATTVRLRPDHHEALRIGALMEQVDMGDIIDRLLEDWVRRNETALSQARELLQPQKLR